MPRPRKIQNRDVRKRILIICEGEKTEPIYFNGIKKDMRSKLSALNIEILKRPKNSSLELVNRGIALMKRAKEDNNKYEYVWIVIDKDSYTKLEETFALAESNKIKIAFSAISFELWYLMHFVFTTKPWTKYSELEKELKNHISNYNKSNLNVYEELKDKTSTAMKNALKLREHCKSDLDAGKRIYDLSSYTNVDELVDLLLRE